MTYNLQEKNYQRSNQAMKYKKLFYYSIVLNLIFILLIVIYILKINILCKESSQEKQNTTELLQIKNDAKPFWYYKNFSYWSERKSLFKVLPADTNDIIFLGNSLTDGCEWNELFENNHIKNRGISGDNIEGVLERIDDLCSGKPEKIFISIGVNDIYMKIPIEDISNNYTQLINNIKSKTPRTKIYIQSLLPTRDIPDRSNNDIIALNNTIKEIANNSSVVFIDLFKTFSDSDGQLKREFTLDGLHLNAKGYLQWKSAIESFVNH